MPYDWLGISSSAISSGAISGAEAVRYVEAVGTAEGTSTVSGVSGATAGSVGAAVGTCVVIAFGANVGWTPQQNDDATWSDQALVSASWAAQASSASDWTEVPMETPVYGTNIISISSSAISESPASGQSVPQFNNKWIAQYTTSSSWVKKAA